ncbi:MULTISPECIES: methyltransferase [Rhizobium]|uniref:Methyltransferase n=1 Tax=Rhizobium dioscoreae TaxID=2653122 RepID=A0ABQ0Z7Q8_9HYPH|nr:MULTISPECIES: methyltransferase [Rhizobium]MCZ3374839.1 methyltransferase domain-containing protein [Rhizobium sp. AG207R]GES51366.1 methyltransferase [Rhizobium dioscoreae]GLU82818.1 methyltransferase [Rhizobium sp. NBRC 114257]
MSPNDFGNVGGAYQRYSEGIRGRIRHELVFQVVAELTAAGGTVLDMGCGDGEIAVRLCEAGFNVLGVDASPEMLRRAYLRKDQLSERARNRLDFAVGTIENFKPKQTFDAVCCHGVLMYLDDSGAAIQTLANHVSPGGLLSILTKNALSNGFREALRGDYELARQLIETGAASRIGNLGISTRGDDPSTIVDCMKQCGFNDCQWRGIRIFSDHLDADSFDDSMADALIALEQATSLRDPYRLMARLFHATGRKNQ